MAIKKIECKNETAKSYFFQNDWKKTCKMYIITETKDTCTEDKIMHEQL